MTSLIFFLFFSFKESFLFKRGTINFRVYILFLTSDFRV